MKGLKFLSPFIGGVKIMAVKKEKIMSEENQSFESKYLSDAVNDSMNNIIKSNKLPGNSFTHLANIEEDRQYIPLNIAELDKGLNGGLPRQTVVEIYGPPGGGKSHLVCYLASSSVTRNYGNVMIYDIENAFNQERAEDLGVATHRVVVNKRYETGEQVLGAICDQLYDPDYGKKHNGQLQPKWADLIVLDSIAALGSKNALEADLVGEVIGNAEKAGPKARVATNATMIAQYSVKLIRAMHFCYGLWNETMPGSFLPDNSLYSFLPEDNQISEALMNDIDAVLKTRQSLIDMKKPEQLSNLHKYVYYAQDRRDRFDSYIKELTELTDEDLANRLSTIILNKKEKNYHEIKDELLNHKNAIKTFQKLDNIMDDLLAGKPILPPTPDVVKEFETMIKGYLYGQQCLKGLPVVHFNPGPTVAIVNQVRVGNIGSFMGTTIERPGGYAFKHAAGTVLYVVPMISKSKGEVRTEDGKDVAGWRSKVVIEKSRYTAPKTDYDFVIPFVKQEIDAFSEFISDCQKVELWDYTRKAYCLPKDGSIIKTKDELEWKEQLMENGLTYLQKQLNYSDDKMIPIFQALEAQLANMIMDEDSDESDDEEDAY
jgi:RecA/RadA recombinase